ncbi:UNVERIFIED_CONTAM: hypothetical protein RMT77_003535 [Armadillidium vulgare]
MRSLIYSKCEAIRRVSSEETRGKLLPQLQVSVVGALTNLGIGAVIGYPGVTFPDLTKPNNNDLTLDQMEVELFGSLAYIGSVFGCFISGFLMVWYGQRKTLLYALPLAMVGWIILGIGDSVWMIQVARILLGVYVGFGYTTASNYVIEIAHHSIRGQLSGLVNVTRQLGFLLVYAVGSTEITWRQLALLSGGITLIIPFLGLLYLPDSPRWLASVQRYDEARTSLVRLRGKLYDVDSELMLIVNQNEKKEKSGTIKEQLKEVKNPLVLRRFLLLNVIYILFSMSGNCSIVTYTALIFKEAHDYLNKYQNTILIGAIRAIASLVFLLIGDKYERRTLMKIPMFMMSLCMLSLGLYFYLKLDHDVTTIRWIPLTSVVTHQFFVCLTPISFLPGELLPTSARSIGASIIWMMSFLSAFIMVFTFPIMEDSIGLYGTFWFYAIDCLIFVLTAFFLPESRGISLEVVNEQEQIITTLNESFNFKNYRGYGTLTY